MENKRTCLHDRHVAQLDCRSAKTITIEWHFLTANNKSMYKPKFIKYGK